MGKRPLIFSSQLDDGRTPECIRCLVLFHSINKKQKGTANISSVESLISKETAGSETR